MSVGIEIPAKHWYTIMVALYSLKVNDNSMSGDQTRAAQETQNWFQQNFDFKDN